MFIQAFAIKEQAEKGDWDYNLNHVYTLSLLDFTLKNVDETKYEHEVKLLDVATKEVFYDKLTFLFYEIPKFKVALEDLKTEKDIWLFLIQNLHKLRKVPESLNFGIFKQVFKMAFIANMTLEEQLAYQDSCKLYWDNFSIRQTAKREGHREGRIEGHKEGRVEGAEEKELEMVIEMLKQGISADKVSVVTKKPLAFIEQIKLRHNL